MHRNCFILIFLLLLNSCDPGSTIKYEIVNKTNEHLFIKYQFPQDSSIQVITIPADSTSVINEKNALGYVDQYDENEDSVYFYKLTVKNNDKKVSQNLKDKKRWKLVKKDELNGAYQLIVERSLFDEQ